jgi:hypothetical protein
VKQLAFAEGLSLPIDVVTQKAAFMGRTGSGKTYAATKLAELLLRAGAQVVAIDPVGVWWGLRLDADGKTPSDLELPIFGGLHGDIPLESTGGKLMADLIVDRALSCVLDVSNSNPTPRRRGSRGTSPIALLLPKKASPSAVHLFLEEARSSSRRIRRGDEQDAPRVSPAHQARAQFRNRRLAHLAAAAGSEQEGAQSDGAPARVPDDRPAGAESDLPLGDREGRTKTSPTSCRARRSDSRTCGRRSGSAISKTVKINEKRTYNASSTPTFGAKAVESKPLGAIDLRSCRSAMAATIEKAKATDPKHLRAEVSAKARA